MKLILIIGVIAIIVGAALYLWQRTPPVRSISWEEAQAIVNQCQAKDLMYYYRNSKADIVIDLKTAQQVDVINPPPLSAAWSFVQAASSTCGPIPFGGEVP